MSTSFWASSTRVLILCPLEGAPSLYRADVVPLASLLDGPLVAWEPEEAGDRLATRWEELDAAWVEWASAGWSPDSKEIFFLDEGRISVVPVDRGERRSIAITAETDVVFGTEKLQVFQQAWSLLQENAASVRAVVTDIEMDTGKFWAMATL